MTEQEKQIRFREAADRRLSALRGDPFLAQRIIADEQGEINMKKKISLGLILALSLALVCAFALAESWQTVSPHQDLTEPMSSPGIQENGNPEGLKAVEHCAIVPIYAPVTVRVNGEEIHLTPAVAQINYLYRLYRTPEGTYVEFNSPIERPILVTQPSADLEWQEKQPENTYMGYDPEAPFSGFLLTQLLGLQIPDASFYQVSDSGTEYRIVFSGEPFTLTYNAEITLDAQGRIIETREDTLEVALFLEDDNGTLLDENGDPIPGARIDDRAFPSILALASRYFAEPTAAAPTIVPAATPVPELLPVYTALPLQRPTPSPIPLDDAAQNASTDTVFQNNQRLYLFYVVEHFHRPGANEDDPDSWVEFVSSDAFRARWNTDLFTSSDAFLLRETHPAFVSDWLEIVQQCSAYEAEYQFVEPPSVTIEYQADAYVVRVLGGRLLFTYDWTIWYNDDAVVWNSTEKQYNYFAHKNYVKDRLITTRNEILDLTFVLPYPAD